MNSCPLWYQYPYTNINIQLTTTKHINIAILKPPFCFSKREGPPSWRVGSLPNIRKTMIYQKVQNLPRKYVRKGNRTRKRWRIMPFRYKFNRIQRKQYRSWSLPFGFRSIGRYKMEKGYTTKIFRTTKKI